MECEKCNVHGSMETRVCQLEKTVEELRSSYINKDDFVTRINFIEEQIKDLKADSEKHYTDNNNLQQMLARLDEFTKSLKESLAQNQRATEQLMEKIDKMYELMVNFKQFGGTETKPNNEIKIINDSNNKSENTKSSEGSNNGNNNASIKALDFLKDYGTIILILVGIIAYLVTGHWPLPTK